MRRQLLPFVLLLVYATLEVLICCGQEGAPAPFSRARDIVLLVGMGLMAVAAALCPSGQRA